MPTIYRNYLGVEYLDTDNTLTLTLADSSSYIGLPELPALEVTIPGYQNYFQVPFKPSLLNSYNSSTLGLNDVFSQQGAVPLPDGIWRVRYKICPYDQVWIDRVFMRTTELNQKVKQIYNEIDLHSCDSISQDYIKKQLVELHILIEGAKAVVERDEKKAYGNYQTANKVADDLLRKFCRNCQIR